jgi:recombination protein RecA
MAKKKETNEDSFFSDLAKETGGEVFKDSGIVSYFIDTGNLALNYICSSKFINGGIPGGKIIEAYGPEAAAKTLIGFCCLGGVQRLNGIGIYEDAERAGNAEFAESCGHLDSSQMVTHYPATIEKFTNNVITATKFIRKHRPDKPILVVWDSIGVAMTERELAEIDLPDKPTKEQIKAAGGNERPGERAKAAGKALRKLCPFVDDNNTTLYIVNQERSNVGVMYGPSKVTAGGGEALKYYASCRLALSARKKIKDKNTKICVGVNLTVRNEKNRTNRPFLSTEGIQVYFDGGINPIGGLLSILIGAGRIKVAGKGTYQVQEPWANGYTKTFKGSLTRNDVPVDVLIECPALVDAKTGDEVKEYLSHFESALHLSSGESIEEESLDADELLNDIVGEKE